MSCSKPNTSNEPSEQQREALVFLMGLEENAGLANGDVGAEFWVDVTQTLNLLGEGCTRNERGWMKTWGNLVGIAKQNLQLLLDGVLQSPLAEQDVRILRILGQDPPIDLPAARVPKVLPPAIENQMRMVSPTSANTPPRQALAAKKSGKRPTFCSLQQLLGPSSNASNPAKKQKLCNTGPPTTQSIAELIAPVLRIIVSQIENMLAAMIDRQREAMDLQTGLLQSYIESQNRILLDNVPTMLRQEVTEALEETRLDYSNQGNEPIPPEMVAGPSRPNVDEEKQECPVCHDILIEPKKLQCGHVFCKYCIKEWMLKSLTCPLCREAIEKDMTVRNDLLTFNVDSESSNDSFFMSDP